MQGSDAIANQESTPARSYDIHILYGSTMQPTSREAPSTRFRSNQTRDTPHGSYVAMPPMTDEASRPVGEPKNEWRETAHSQATALLPSTINGDRRVLTYVSSSYNEYKFFVIIDVLRGGHGNQPNETAVLIVVIVVLALYY